MKWLKVYGLPKLPLFLARWAMRLGLPGPTWYKWKAAASGTGVILDEMIRAADDLGYDGQKIGKLAMTRIGEKQGTDLREQLGVKTMKDRKSTRLNSSHANISYAVFCLKKKMT